MARTWRTERTTPKQKQKAKPRSKRVLIDPYCDAPRGSAEWCVQRRIATEGYPASEARYADIESYEAQAYLEADA